MKTFLNILIGVALVILVIKVGPLVAALAIAGLAIAAVLLTAGLALLGLLLTILVGIALALAPIWLPVLAIVGLVSLYKHTNRDAELRPAA